LRSCDDFSFCVSASTANSAVQFLRPLTRNRRCGPCMVKTGALGRNHEDRNLCALEIMKPRALSNSSRDARTLACLRRKRGGWQPIAGGTVRQLPSFFIGLGAREPGAILINWLPPPSVGIVSLHFPARRLSRLG
jgi:hypothetical protein